jgi:hypothetical protein
MSANAEADSLSCRPAGFFQPILRQHRVPPQPSAGILTCCRSWMCQACDCHPPGGHAHNEHGHKRALWPAHQGMCKWDSPAAPSPAGRWLQRRCGSLMTAGRAPAVAQSFGFTGRTAVSHVAQHRRRACLDELVACVCTCHRMLCWSSSLLGTGMLYPVTTPTCI